MDSKYIELINQLETLENIIDIVSVNHPYDIAYIFKDLSVNTRNKLYSELSDEVLADIFSYIDSDDAADLLSEMNVAKGASILSEMETDDAADVLNELEEDHEASAYLKQLSKENRAELEYLQHHAENTAGSIMSTNYIVINPEMDVKDAMRHLIKEASEAEMIDPLFVCRNDVLVGVIELKDLIIARSPKTIEEIMSTNFITSQVTENLAITVGKIKDYDIYALPIIDNGKMVGVITMDDAIDVTYEDVAEDYSKLAGVSSDVDDDKHIFKNMFKRLPWLIALLIISFFVANIMSRFDDTIKKLTILVFFQTMILDMAGNIGTQSLAVTIRSIGRHELDDKKHVRLHFFKELRIVIINSIILGILSYLVCYIFILINHNSSNVNIYMVALVISLSMMLSLIITGLLSSLIPLAFAKIKVDPAVASGPLITTMNDIFAVIIYFGLATLFMNLMIK